VLFRSNGYGGDSTRNGGICYLERSLA